MREADVFACFLQKGNPTNRPSSFERFVELAAQFDTDSTPSCEDKRILLAKQGFLYSGTHTKFRKRLAFAFFRTRGKVGRGNPRCTAR
jgi:hypothetical protein